MMTKKQMVCDLQTGICGEVDTVEEEIMDFSIPQSKITLHYFSDPICSHCWALEPELRKFTLAYGQYFDIQLTMGGLLPNWDGFADVSNGIGGPADVAGHWQEVGEHSRMPIDGTFWLSDPVQSSYPPSRVFAVIQQQDPKKAEHFLRRLREQVFAFNENIGKQEVLMRIVEEVGLNAQEIIEAANGTVGETLLQEGFIRMQQMGVRGFPSIVMIDEDNKGIKLVGQRRAEDYATSLEKLLGKSVIPQTLPRLSKVLKKEKRLFAKEIEVLYDIAPAQLQQFIANELSAEQYETHEILGELYIEMK